MLDLMESDDEILGVLAHEVGHLEQRHGLRIILQDALSALLIAALTGDLSNVSTLSATVPTVLMQAKYSRDFEREADQYAFAYLETNERDTNALATLLDRVERESRSGSGNGPAAWFSSHPPSDEPACWSAATYRSQSSASKTAVCEARYRVTRTLAQGTIRPTVKMIAMMLVR